jgi:hypothetical protein
MTRWIRWVGGLLLLTVGISGFVACGSDDEPGVDHEGLRMCCEIGAYCHPPAGTIADEQHQHCHNLGHADDPVACRAEYDSCMALCADNPSPSEHSCAE